MRVKFKHEPDLRIYDSENRPQETYFKPVTLSQGPLTDQEIEEQERQVQRLIRETEMREKVQQQHQIAASTTQSHAPLPLLKDSNINNGSSSGISRRPSNPAGASSGSGNQLSARTSQQPHSNAEIRHEEKEGEERRRRNNNNNAAGRNQPQHASPAAAAAAVTSGGQRRGSNSLHDSMRRSPIQAPASSSGSNAVVDPHGIPAGAVLLHPNSNRDGIRNHRSHSHENQQQSPSSILHQHQQGNQHGIHSSISSGSSTSVGILDAVSGSTGDLSQQSITSSIKTIPASGKIAPVLLLLLLLLTECGIEKWNSISHSPFPCISLQNVNVLSLSSPHLVPLEFQISIMYRSCQSVRVSVSRICITSGEKGLHINTHRQRRGILT